MRLDTSAAVVALVKGSHYDNMGSTARVLGTWTPRLHIRHLIIFAEAVDGHQPPFIRPLSPAASSLLFLPTPRSSSSVSLVHPSPSLPLRLSSCKGSGVKLNDISM